MPFDVEVFKAGNYPQGEWPPEKVKKMVDDYDPKFLKAPVTKDHGQWGESDGWVIALRLEGDTVVATLDELSTELYGEIKDAKYRTVSIEPFDPLAETGGPYLGAVSFLGAANPQVKGLKEIKFSDESRKVFIDLGDHQEHSTQGHNTGNDTTSEGSDGIVSKLKDSLKNFFNLAVDELDEAELGTAATAPPAQQMSAEGVAAEEIVAANNQLAADLKTARAELAAERAKHADSRAARRTEEIHSFCESLKREGKLIPAWQDAGIEAFMLSLESLEDKKKFAEKDKEERTPAEFFRDLLKGMPELVKFAETAAEEGGQPADSDEHEFMQVARQYAEEKKCSMSAAMSHVVKKQPELHQAFLEHQMENRG